MEDFTARRVPVFARFSYEEVGAFRLEVLGALQRHRRAWRLQRGEVPVDDALEILDALPGPDSRFARWHQGLRPNLVIQATQWAAERGQGAAAPSPLCEDALVEFYLAKLEKHFEPHKQRGKLLEYEAL